MCPSSNRLHRSNDWWCFIRRRYLLLSTVLRAVYNYMKIFWGLRVIIVYMRRAYAWGGMITWYLPGLSEIPPMGGNSVFALLAKSLLIRITAHGRYCNHRNSKRTKRRKHRKNRHTWVKVKLTLAHLHPWFSENRRRKVKEIRRAKI